jgi:hypothetical protein
VYSTYELDYKGGDKYDKEFARNMLMEQGDTLRMEYMHEIRFGEFFKFYLPYLAALIRGQPGDNKLDIVHRMFFLSALFLLLFEFSRCGRPLLGSLVALMISSSEFQAYQVTHGSFSYIITGATFTVACMAPFLFGKPLRPAAIVVRLLLCSSFIVLCGNVRTTAMCMFLGPPLVLLFYRRLSVARRALLLATYLAVFAAVYRGTQTYFNHKFEQAIKFVEAVGGVPYLGERTNNHPFWHPIWCGMGDFDEEYGHVWRDARAWKVAEPTMRMRGWQHPEMDDTKGDYYTLCTNPLYEEVIRGIVLKDIRNDPMWYLGIIGKRIRRTFTEWQQPRLELVFRTIELPKSFVPYLAATCVFLLLGMWAELKLVVLTLPTAALAIAITTCTNGHYYLIAHLVCGAVILVCVVNGIVYLVKYLAARRTGKRARGSGPDDSALEEAPAEDGNSPEMPAPDSAVTSSPVRQHVEQGPESYSEECKS